MLNLVNAVENTNQEFLCRGEDAVNVFCNNLNEIRDDIKERMQDNKEIGMTDEDKEAFNNATHYFFYVVRNFGTLIRLKKEAEKYKKVRDHCHFTGRYRGCAHSICNPNYCSKRFKIPVCFHNTKKYDGHLIIQNAEKFSNKKKIDEQWGIILPSYMVIIINHCKDHH